VKLVHPTEHQLGRARLRRPLDHRIHPLWVRYPAAALPYYDRHPLTRWRVLLKLAGEGPLPHGGRENVLRRPMRAALEHAARLLTGGRLTAEHVPWQGCLGLFTSIRHDYRMAILTIASQNGIT
jgi:hypothetical protein